LTKIDFFWVGGGLKYVILSSMMRHLHVSIPCHDSAAKIIIFHTKKFREIRSKINQSGYFSFFLDKSCCLIKIDKKKIYYGRNKIFRLMISYLKNVLRKWQIFSLKFQIKQIKIEEIFRLNIESIQSTIISFKSLFFSIQSN
jgi:hypothetical protein